MGKEGASSSRIPTGSLWTSGGNLNPEPCRWESNIKATVISCRPPNPMMMLPSKYWPYWLVHGVMYCIIQVYHLYYIGIRKMKLVQWKEATKVTLHLCDTHDTLHQQCFWLTQNFIGFMWMWQYLAFFCCFNYWLQVTSCRTLIFLVVEVDEQAGVSLSYPERESSDSDKR